MSLNKPIWKLKDWIKIHNLDYYVLNKNPNAISILFQNTEKIDWQLLSANSGIFELDYEAMAKNNEEMYEELIKEVTISETETITSL